MTQRKGLYRLEPFGKLRAELGVAISSILTARLPRGDPGWGLLMELPGNE